MKSKDLQSLLQSKSNYTTIEQSKQLLKLAVPEWTADCLIKNNEEKDKPTIRVKEHYTGYYFANDEYVSCWSVGQIIKIMNVCSLCGHVSIHRTDREVTQIEQLIEMLQNRINNKTIDFSKFKLEY